jgi:hypothetical protein
MRRQSIVFAALLIAGAVESPYAAHAVSQANAGWVTLFDGKSLDQWNTIGDANWKLVDGVVQADTGTGFLVSKSSYGDFQLRAEFWVDTPANSGVFLRCSDPSNVTAANAYEVNIFDTRPDPTYGTAAIVNVAKVSPMPKAGGQWNTFEITARGSHLAVTLNGTRTAEGDDSQHARGPIALQHGAGVVKFRKVEIKPL